MPLCLDTLPANAKCRDTKAGDVLQLHLFKLERSKLMRKDWEQYTGGTRPWINLVAFEGKLYICDRVIRGVVDKYEKHNYAIDHGRRIYRVECEGPEGVQYERFVTDFKDCYSWDDIVARFAYHFNVSADTAKAFVQKNFSNAAKRLDGEQRLVDYQREMARRNNFAKAETVKVLLAFLPGIAEKLGAQVIMGNCLSFPDGASVEIKVEVPNG